MVMTALSETTTACRMYGEPAWASRLAKTFPSQGTLKMKSHIVLVLPSETHWLQTDRGFAFSD